MRSRQYPDYLAHYGIKGMKWGVRRFQNKNGSYTAAGLKRRFGGGGGSSRRSGSGKARSGSGTNAEAQARKAKIKKALMIGAGIAGTAALAYGIKSGKLKGVASAVRNSKAGRAAVNGTLRGLGNAQRGIQGAAKSIKKGMDRTNPNSAYSKARSKISSARINAGMNVAGAASNLRKSVSSSKLRNSKVGRAAVNTTLKGLGNAQRIPGNIAGAARATRRSIASRGITRDKLRNTLTGNNSSRLNSIKSVGRSVAKNKVARAAGLGAASLGAGYAGMAGLSAAQKKVRAKQGYNQYSSKSNKGTRKRKRRAIKSV